MQSSRNTCLTTSNSGKSRDTENTYRTSCYVKWTLTLLPGFYECFHFFVTNFGDESKKLVIIKESNRVFFIFLSKKQYPNLYKNFSPTLLKT
jgi:hypothetical protein